MINWRILQKVIAIIPISLNNSQIYLTSSDKKQYISLATKKISAQSFKEIAINNNFKLKVSSNLGYNNKYLIDILVKSNELPDPDKWYTVENIYNPFIGNIISQSSIKDGIFEDEFEAIFSDAEEANDKISFINPKMKEYNICLEETRRILNCEIFSKTKKYKPGHRYDNIAETRFYLCPILTNKESSENSELIRDPEQYKEAYLYVNNIKTETEKTISDVLKNRSLGNSEDSIKIGYNNPLMVDSGKCLDNDFSGNIQDYWDYLIDNAEKLNKETLQFGYTYTKDISQILNVFTCFSKDQLEIKKEWKDRLIPILIKSLQYVIYTCWENPFYYKYTGIQLLNTNSIEDNSESLYKALIYKQIIDDQNILKSIFYKQLLNQIGIDIKNLAVEVLSNWSTEKLINSFEDFLKYSFYYDLRNEDTVNVSHQKTSINKTDIKTLTSLYGESELTKIIKEIIEYASNHLGQGLYEFSSINIGTTKNPIRYITCKVTLADIYNYFKGEIPQSLQEDIMMYHFTSVVVIYDDKNKLE